MAEELKWQGKFEIDDHTDREVQKREIDYSCIRIDIHRQRWENNEEKSNLECLIVNSTGKFSKILCPWILGSALNYPDSRRGATLWQQRHLLCGERT